MAAGELDIATAQMLARVLDRACDTHLSVVVDLTDVTFVDAATLRQLDRARDRLRGDGQRLVIVGPRPMVRRVLEVGGFADTVGV